MHRIDTVTAQKDKFGAGKNGFTRGNPQTGTPATDLDDDYFDMLQEELCAVVEESGEELDKGKHNQLLTALRSLLLSRSNPFGDIASDGPEAIATALANLGLEESAFGYKNMVVFSAPGVVNWVVPDELRKGRKCYVKVIGGGGSGGRAAGGGGGGGGGVAEKLTDLTEVESVTLTVGNGGIAPVAGTSNIAGTNGGTTSFGSILSATGGTGGATPSGGACGVGIGGDFNTSLGPGNPGSSFSTSFVGGGGGGPGGQGAVDTSTHDGIDAYGPGGGGAGAALGAPAVAGRAGKGGNGVIIIRW